MENSHEIVHVPGCEEVCFDVKGHTVSVSDFYTKLQCSSCTSAIINTYVGEIFVHPVLSIICDTTVPLPQLLTNRLSFCMPPFKSN